MNLLKTLQKHKIFVFTCIFLLLAVLFYVVVYAEGKEGLGRMRRKAGGRRRGIGMGAMIAARRAAQRAAKAKRAAQIKKAAQAKRAAQKAKEQAEANRKSEIARQGIIRAKQKAAQKAAEQARQAAERTRQAAAAAVVAEQVKQAEIQRMQPAREVVDVVDVVDAPQVISIDKPMGVQPAFDVTTSNTIDTKSTGSGYKITCSLYPA